MDTCKTKYVDLGNYLWVSAVCFVFVSFCMTEKGFAASSDVPTQAPKEYGSLIKEDPMPLQLARNSHFLTSNENHQDRFFEVLSKKKGDVYIGVGSEQNYLFSGWSRPDRLILMDFDQMVVDLHRVYRVIFLHANTPDQFLNLWNLSAQNTRQIESWILEAYGKQSTRSEGSKVCENQCRLVLKAYRVAKIHQAVYRRLIWIQKQYRRKGIPTFLTDLAQYQFIRGLFQKELVLMARGDLSQQCLKSIGDLMTKEGWKLGTLYLSNAERYFSYIPYFKTSIQSLPIRLESSILHTWALKNEGNRYAYFVQSAQHFLEWLKDPEVTSVRTILKKDLRKLRSGKYGAFPQPAVTIQGIK